MSSAAHLAAKTLTFILAGGRGERLYPLTADQPKPALPFGGVFRIIDFSLSNALNSGLRRIYVLTQYKQERLHSYVREGWSQLCDEFRWDYGELLYHHATSRADVTMVAVQYPAELAGSLGVIDTDPSGRVIGSKARVN